MGRCYARSFVTGLRAPLGFAPVRFRRLSTWLAGALTVLVLAGCGGGDEEARGEPETWTVIGTQRVPPDATSFTIQYGAQSCGAPDDRLVDVDVQEAEDEVVISVLARKETVEPGEMQLLCKDVFKRKIELDAPLGDRKLVDPAESSE